MGRVHLTEFNTHRKYITVSDTHYCFEITPEVWDTVHHTKIFAHLHYWVKHTDKVLKYATVQVVDSIPSKSSEFLRCEICSKTYKSRSGLTRHIKSYHTEKKPDSNERTIATQTEEAYDEVSLLETCDYEDVDPSASVGYVYCFRCESMPGTYKIGMTTCDIESRLAQANRRSTWQLPNNYTHLLSKRVNNPRVKEQLIHKVLDEYRVSPRREFFKVPLTKIKYMFALLTEVHSTETIDE